MTAPEKARKRATYEDILNAPENVVAEILDGELFLTPRPSFLHGVASSVLGGEIGPPFHRGRGGPGGWWIIFEPELHLGADVLVPDLAGWRRERMPTPPEGVGVTVFPDWVCEVLSPSTERTDRMRKLRIYAREGVGHAWLVSPDQRTLEIFRLKEGQWVLLAVYGDDEVLRAEPFDAIELDLLPLWGEERAEEGEGAE